MSVVDLKTAKKLAPSAFGLGPPPLHCDLCLKAASGLTRTPYGPFTVWCCIVCLPRMIRLEETRKRERAVKNQAVPKTPSNP